VSPQLIEFATLSVDVLRELISQVGDEPMVCLYSSESASLNCGCNVLLHCFRIWAYSKYALA